ncbi:AraC family transcriptional regulator [Pseudomonas abieticivorans]|uniref:AraC family transcriptional regulator n=1 Tax=Pseudomonas abieticivorans TaxID=2931382 RepID=UPI0020C09EFA|nr:AraC family transcriptional regulator [Pseudomonas sp. PIA16]
MLQKDTIAVPLLREALLQSGLTDGQTLHLLASVGIAPTLLEQPEGRIPALAYARLWRRLALLQDDEFFGMDPRRLRSGSLAFLCRSSMAQPTVAGAIASGLGFLSLMLEGLAAEFSQQQGLAEIVLSERDPQPRRAFTYFTYWMIVHGVLCWLAGRRMPILAVELRCSEPAFTDDYRVMFSHNLRFERPRTRIIFSAEGLEQPVRRTEAQLQRFLNRAPGNILVKYRDPDSLGRRISQQLRQLPPDTWPEAARLAQDLCMSASTLRRRLGEEGHTWQGLKDSVRKELAIQWLAEGERPFSDIAEHLGFADASSFYKAFRKWTGASPGHYRGMILDGTGQIRQFD